MVDMVTSFSLPPGHTAGPHLLTTSRAGCVRPGPQFKDRRDGTTSRLSTQPSASSLSFPLAAGPGAYPPGGQSHKMEGTWVSGTSDGRHIPPAMGLYMSEK